MVSDNFFQYILAGIKGFKIYAGYCDFQSVLMFTFPIVLQSEVSVNTIIEFITLLATKDVVASLKIIIIK